MFINHLSQYKELEIKWDWKFSRFRWWVHDGCKWCPLLFLTALYSHFCDFNVPASKEKFLVWKADLCWSCLHAPSCSWLTRSPVLYMTYLMEFLRILLENLSRSTIYENSHKLALLTLRLLILEFWGRSSKFVLIYLNK